LKVIGYPYCSARPAHTKFADAPIRVPFPALTNNSFINKILFEYNRENVRF